jgi:serine/threonine-protein kinase
MSLSPGTRLAQYEIVAPLGAGGMGEVYRARDLRLERDVAIKVMAEHVAADPEMRRRFETEAKAVAALSHPAIMSIYELAFVGDTPLAVMELLEGETLRERLRRGAIAWRDAVQIGAVIADGLAAAHGKGVIHRDLKPENVFITTEGAVKVLDFGLALQRLGVLDEGLVPTQAHTAQGLVLGTFGYMSPEQVLGERVDGRSDIFATGCVIYEMLCGKRLFAGDTPQEVIANLMHDSLPQLSAFDPLAPSELRAIVSRCVERDRSRRFESAADLGMALRSLLTGSAAKAAGRRPKPRGKSLAVLPFVNEGVDPSFEYLTDGITESIINSLSQLGGLRVVPRSLVFRYKGLQADPATVGLALNARTILTGRVVQHGDVLSIQAELVDTANESQLWGERFRQKTTDLLTVQEEIAWQISEALRLKLTGEQKKKLRKRDTVNADAKQEYLRGRYHWNTWSPEGFRRALEHFERAIACDPLYAQAFAGLGDAYGAMAYYGHIDPRDGFPRARAAAERAIALDPDIGDPHVTLAIERLFAGWDWAASEGHLQTAIRLSPKLALAHSVYALFLGTVGRPEESLKEALIGRDLDPLSLFANMGVVWAYHFGGRHEDAAREAKKTLDIAAGFEEAVNVIVSSYEWLNRYRDAIAMMGATCWGVPVNPAELLAAFESGGVDGYWLKRLEMLDRVAATAPPAIHFAYTVCYYYLRQPERMVDHLELMVEHHVGGCVFAGADQCLVTLRGNPRYDALVKRIGVPLPRTASAPHTAST